MSARAKYFITGVGVFAYGGFTHLLMLRLFVCLAFRNPERTSFVNHPLSNAALALLGGAWVAALMLSLLRRIRAQRSPGFFAVLWRATLRGEIATLLTLETFYVLTSVYAALLYTHGDAGEPSLISWFLLSMIDIQTYGIVPIVFSIPFGLLIGALAGLFLLWVSKFLSVGQSSSGT